jgi:alpha-D-xyloside xylohydrolase
MVKPNSVIPLGNNTERPDYEYAEGLRFHVFELEPGKTASSRVCNIRGETMLELAVDRREETYTFTVTERELKNRSWSICLRGIRRCQSLEGASAREGEQGLVLTPHPDSRRIVLAG